MARAFISYSRADSHQALAVSKALKAAGTEAWLDQQSIDAASIWSQEIVHAIEGCDTFILLLSSSSVASENVFRELALAVEFRKRILPVEIDHEVLPASFRYALAGIQRTPIANVDAIVRAASGSDARIITPPHPDAKDPDHTKSLLVLPFDDLSPEKNNAWFADGLTGELISVLSSVKALQVQDRQTSMSFKGYTGKTATIVRELGVQFVIEGSVRKFQEQIKITVDLRDARQNKHLWTGTKKGAFADIFEIQEGVAAEVLQALQLQLNAEEQIEIRKKGTSNAEAYELYLRAADYFGQRTRTGIEHAIDLYSQAIHTDPGYAEAHRSQSLALTVLYRNYNRKPELLTQAEQLALRARELDPELWRVCDSLSKIYLQQGRTEDAERAAQTFVQHAPEDFLSHASLGFCYDHIGQPAKAVAPYEQALRIKPDARLTIWNLLLVLNQIHDEDAIAFWARNGVMQYKRWLRLHPDDTASEVTYANMLLHAGERAESLAILRTLTTRSELDGKTLYNIGCLYANLDEPREAFSAIELAVTAGYANVQAITADPELTSVRAMPEFSRILARLSFAE